MKSSSESVKHSKWVYMNGFGERDRSKVAEQD